jgi:hypothetical protein
MTQLTVNIADSKVKDFLELINSLDYVTLEDKKEIALKELEDSLREVKQMREGTLPKQSAEEFLDEL